MKHLSMFLGFLFITSCSIWDDNNEITQPFSVESISIENISDNTVILKAKNNCGSICWKRTFFESSIITNEVFVKTISVFDESAVCPAVCVEVETPISISLPSDGTYTFHFWQSDSTTLDTTIVVN